MHCPECGHANLDTSDFCGECGTALAASRDVPVRATQSDVPSVEASDGMPPPGTTTAPAIDANAPPPAAAPQYHPAASPPESTAAAVATTPVPPPSPPCPRCGSEALPTSHFCGECGEPLARSEAVANLEGIAEVLVVELGDGVDAPAATLPPPAAAMPPTPSVSDFAPTSPVTPKRRWRRRPRPTRGGTGGGRGKWGWIIAAVVGVLAVAVIVMLPPLGGNSSSQGGGPSGQYGGGDHVTGGSSQIGLPSAQEMAKVYVMNGLPQAFTTAALKSMLPNVVSQSLDVEQIGPTSKFGYSNDGLYRAADQCGVGVGRFRQGLQQMLTDQGYRDAVTLELIRTATTSQQWGGQPGQQPARDQAARGPQPSPSSDPTQADWDGWAAMLGLDRYSDSDRRTLEVIVNGSLRARGQAGLYKGMQELEAFIGAVNSLPKAYVDRTQLAKILYWRATGAKSFEQASLAIHDLVKAATWQTYNDPNDVWAGTDGDPKANEQRRQLDVMARQALMSLFGQ